MDMTQRDLLRDITGLTMPEVAASLGRDDTGREGGPRRRQGDGVRQILFNCTRCGGLTEAWRIAWMAYDHNIQWVPHGWNTAIGLAADLHSSAAMPVARYVEDLTPSPYLDEIITEPFRADAKGYLPIPTKPGLGIELNRESMRRFGA